MAAIVGLFAVSVVVRIPSFGIHPMADAGWTQFQRWNNTEVWQHNALVLHVYRTYPVSEHKFAGYISHAITGPKDTRFLPAAGLPGLQAYTSFPSTHFVVLYLALKLLGLGFTYGASQVFGLVLHALAVGLVAWLVHLLTGDKAMTVIAAAMYTFSTGTLWYQMNVYWAHQLLMPVFLLALAIFVRRGGRTRWWQALLLGLAMTAIGWTGAVASLGFVLYGVYKYVTTKDKEFLGNLFMAAGMAVAVTLVVVQGLVATGVSPARYLASVMHRAEARSAGAGVASVPLMIWRFVNDLILDYGAFALIALVVAVVARHTLSRFQWEVALVATFPLLESLVVLEHDTTYGFGRLKWLVPVILLACMAGANLSTRGRLRLAAATGVAVLVHVALFYVVYDVAVA